MVFLDVHLDITSQNPLPICCGHTVGLHFANKNRVVHACQLRENQTRQLFCDGSNQDAGFEPVKFTAQRDGEVYFCGFKASALQPLFDGARNKLKFNA